MSAHQLKPGDDIYEGVNQGVRLWDKVLLCCSEASLSSWWVEREVDTAIEKEQQLSEKHGHQKLAIIPLSPSGGRSIPQTVMGKFASRWIGQNSSWALGGNALAGSPTAIQAIGTVASARTMASASFA